MFKKIVGCLVLSGCLALPVSSHAGMKEEWAQFKRDCSSRGGTVNSQAYNNWDGKCHMPSSPSSSGSSGSSSTPTYDYEAERRAQEQAEAARRAEEARQAELEQ